MLIAFTSHIKGRFTRSNFFIQLFFSPLFKTTTGCVTEMGERQFFTSFRHFYVLDENRTYSCSISIQLDQKSRHALLDLAAVKWAQILKTRIVVFLWSTSRNNWIGKLDYVNASIFRSTQQNLKC